MKFLKDPILQIYGQKDSEIKKNPHINQETKYI